MRYFSLFTGIGGLDYGLADWCKNVGFSEIKKSSIDVYLNHYDHKNFGDITKIDYKKLPDFDILTGGFPCQAFSLAGLRKGFEDKKGQLIFHIYDMLVEKQPKYVVLENVKGLISHRNGKTLVDVLKLLKMTGYYCRVLLLNACNYGSAQNRERVIFLASLEDFEKKEVIKIDDSKRFRDIIDKDESNYKFIKLNDRIIDKLDGKLQFSFELIGGYDRVGTLTTQVGCGEKLVQYNDRWRILTPLECERLQGFKDNWTENTSLTGRYFALGNAVNCNMSEYIFKNYLKGLWW